ncbi:DUF7706 family protein [Buttiauxella agrestis]
MSNESEKITVTFELTKAQALALAQFVKRTTFTDCHEHATSENEAYLMMDGVNSVMSGLAEAGFNPR